MADALHDYGSVEGYLEMLSIRGGPHIGVREQIHGRTVRCDIADEEVERTAYRAFRRRVIVSGLVGYRKGEDFTPARIAVDHVEEIPADSELPTEEDVYGILTKAE